MRLVEQAELDRQLGTIPELPLGKLRDPFLKANTIFGKIYTIVEWTSTYREAVGNDWWRFFEVVQGFALNAKNIRIVFYFDS